MRFVYSVSSIRSFYNSAVEPLFCNAIQDFNSRHLDFKALEVFMIASNIDRLVRARRLSANSRALLIRFIDNILSDSPIICRFREMVTARR